MSGDSATEVVSPELALVCPELAAAARARLPERDPDAFLLRPGANRTGSRRGQRARRPVEVTVALPQWLATVLYVVVMSSALFVRGLAVALVLAVPLSFFLG